MILFGWFKGLPYNHCNECFESFREFHNNIPKEKVIAHIETLEAGYACVESFDIFTGEKLIAGEYIDGDFGFPMEFLHYYKNYDIGIPYEYEEYLKQILN